MRIIQHCQRRVNGRRWVGTALAIALSYAAPALSADRALQAVNVTSFPGDRVELILQFSESAPVPKVFATDDPARVAIDLFETRNEIADRVQAINVGNTRSVAFAEANGRTRVVVELTELGNYETRVEGNRIYLSLSDLATGSAPPGSRVEAVSGAPADGISRVDFRRSEGGAGQILITLTNPKVSVDVRDEGGRIVAEFKNTPIADELVRRLDVLDFATPVKFIDTMRDGINTKFIVTPTSTGDFEQVAYQSGNTFALELVPLSPEEKEQRARLQPQYSGEKITLNFQNVDVRAILQIIADVAGKNLVASDSVTGTIALRLENVPWDQALEIVLRTKGLDSRSEGNVLLIGTIQEIAGREEAELTALTKQEQLAPLRSELIRINYARANDIKTLIDAGGGGGGAAGEKMGRSRILSERGSASVDERTNTLIVNDTREKIGEVRRLILELDIPVRQVLIESRIVVANDDFSRDLGARVGVAGIQSTGDNLFVTSGTLESANGPVQSVLNSGGAATNLGTAFGSPFARDNVSLPASSSRGVPQSIALAILGADYLVDLELSALQAEGRGEVVSTPRVITADSHEARIEQGFEIPYQERGEAGQVTVSFKKAVLSLTVTPQITPDNRIIMDLNVTRDEADFSRAVLGVPPINTREVTTQVLVLNGETVVLGGVYEQSNTENETKVPLLGDIPILGALFRSKSISDSKSELLMFVTPKIISEGINVN